MKRSGARGSGDFKPVSWDEAIAELVSRLDALAAAGDQKALAYVARPRPGRRMVLAAEFVVGFGAPAPYGFEPFDDAVLRHANAMSWGKEQLATVDLARARFVISFGADFLGTWNSPVAQSVGYGAMRQGRPGVRGAFVQVESRMSLTGANADQWIPVKPGTEGVLALGLAHVILANKLRPAATGRVAESIAGWSNGLGEYTPARVEQITGVAAGRVERLARELLAVDDHVKRAHAAVVQLVGDRERVRRGVGGLIHDRRWNRRGHPDSHSSRHDSAGVEDGHEHGGRRADLHGAASG